MKNNFLINVAGIILLAVFSAITLFAQAPQAFKYQAIVHDVSGNIVPNQNVSLQISILSGSPGGSSVFTETHTATTNPFGLVNLEIGTGSLVSGNFAAINWGNNSYYIKIELDITGSTNYAFMGTSQLLSVPYALYAASGTPGPQGDPGQDGISITWLGALPSAPSNPTLNEAYYNMVNKKSYIYNGTSWSILAQDGAAGAAGTPGIQGVEGPQGIPGTNGISVTWLGTFGTAPSTPAVNEAYYDSVAHVSYIYNGAAWQLLSRDGSTGPQGPQGLQGPAGTGLNNRGSWTSGTEYTNGDYVFDMSSADTTVNTMWICESVTFISTVHPYLDNANWAEFQAPQGEQGVQGPQGQQGAPGEQGLQGEQGIPGAQGPAGTEGPQGPAGNNGANGISLTWLGEYDYAPVSPTFNNAYYNVTDRISYIYDGMGWQVLAKDGQPGPQGPQGPAGTGLNNMGNWTSGTSYISGDYVFDRSLSDSTKNSMWICEQESSFISLLPPYIDTLNWVEFEAPQGQQGIQGVQGPAGPEGPQGTAGADGTNGVNGISIQWLGTFTAHPASPALNQAYYNSTDKKSYIYNGASWNVLSQDGSIGSIGPQGPQGLQGTAGANGISIVWLGSFAAAPSGAVDPNNAYYNTTEKKSYIYNGSDWQLLAQDGMDGNDGISLTWLGTYDTTPAGASLNDAYYNSTERKSYIFDGTVWQTLAQDGADGTDGLPGAIGSEGPQGPEGPQGLPGQEGTDGIDGTNGAPGANGISLVWLGSLAVTPSTPAMNQAYYNTANKKSYVWDGITWNIFAQDGAQGTMGPQGSQGEPGIDGAQGTQGVQGNAGQDGVSIAWSGSLATAPLSPVLNQGYYNTTEKKSYIWNGSMWKIIAQDGNDGAQGIQGEQGLQGDIGPAGTDGANGISLVWSGSSASAPASPALNQAYYNTTVKKSYVWNGTSWNMIAQDGNDGATGPQGPQGIQGEQGDPGPQGGQGIPGTTGANGISISWLGSLAAAPGSPSPNQAYYNSTEKKSYIYNGSTWNVLTVDGVTGPQGLQGVPGTGLNNRGTWSSASAYVDGDYVFDRSSLTPTVNSMWICQADVSPTSTQPYQDPTHWVEFEAPQGPAGNDGASVEWLGTLASAPGSPVLNQAYYNSTDKKSYIYNGSIWQTLSQDGATGPQGIQGPAGSYTQGTGISLAGNVVTNTLPDVPVSLTGTGSTSVTGTYPNFTINSSQTLAQTLTLGNSAGSTNIDMNGKSILNANVLGVGNNNANYLDLFYGHIRDYNGSHGANGQVLTVHGTTPNTYVTWDTPIAYSSGTGITQTGNSFSHTAHTGDVTGATALTIATGAVTTTKLADNNVNGAKIALGSDQGGDLMYYNGTDYVRLPKATDGKVLKLSGGIPAWSDETATPYTPGTGINIISNQIINMAPDQIVTLSNGTGITASGTYPNFTITNSAPDRTVTLTGSGATSVSGTYPNFTISSTDNNTTYSPGTGIDITGTTVTNTSPNATHTGDATGSGALAVVKIQGRDVANTAPSGGQVLKWNSSNSKWEPNSDNGTSYIAGTGIDITGTTISNTATDRTVVLTGTGATSVSGTYPNFTINSTDNNTTYSPGTGLTLAGTTFNSAWTQSGNDIYNNTTGNVGIGISSPAYKLHVYSTGAATYAKLGNSASYYDNRLFFGDGSNVYVGEEGADNRLSLKGTSMAVTINGSPGTSGQVLKSNGTTVSWGTDNSTCNWTLNGSLLYNNNYATGKVGIGTTTPAGKLVVKGDASQPVGEPLFEVKNSAGQSVFVVYADSVKVIVPDSLAGQKGIAIGGFAVSGRSSSKGSYNDYLRVTPDSTRIWTCDTVKGFGVRNIGATSKTSYMQLTPKNYFIGHEAGKSITYGRYNSFMGYQSGYSTTGSATPGGYGSFNTFMGYQTGFANTTGWSNTIIGYKAGYSNTNGNSNIYIGDQAGYSNNGSHNTFVGFEAGRSHTNENYNSYFGYSAGSLSTGQGNTYVGENSGQQSYAGKNNAYFGCQSGYESTGNYNSYLGYGSGANAQSGSENTYVGFDAGFEATGSNNVFIGKGSGYDETGSNMVWLGNSNTTSLFCMGAYVATAWSPANLCVDADGQIMRAAGALSGTGSNGRITFWNGTYSFGSSSNLNWDNTNSRLGIGTTSPLASLQINSSGDVPFLLLNTTSSTNRRARLQFGQGGTNSWELATDANSNNTDDLYFYDRLTSTFGPVIKNNGNVGIGTTSPGQKLEIGGTNAQIYMNSSSSNMLFFNSSGAAAPTSGTRSLGTKIVFYPDLVGSNSDYAMGIDGYTLWYSVPGATSNHSHKFYGGTTELMRIRGDGNVGIGSNSPAYKLYVVNTVPSNDDPAIVGEHAVTDNWGVGVKGSAKFRGVEGYASTAAGEGCGVYGNASGAGAGIRYGIYGVANGGATAYAGYFSGNVHVNGTLSKNAGTFKIDHPMDPENKYLVHSFVESPDMKNVYDGVVVLDNQGRATVTMPSYFATLNKDFRYQLTPIGAYAPLYIDQEIINNQFVIAGGTPGLKVSWQITGSRQDPYALQHPVIVEEEKALGDKGKYLNPELYDQPVEKAMNSFIQK